MTAGLPLVPALRLGLRADGFPVRDTRGANLDLHAELVPQVMDRDLDGGFADRRQDRLVRRVLAADVQGRILVGELVQGGRELVEVRLARWFDRHGERWRRELDRVVEDRGV